MRVVRWRDLAHQELRSAKTGEAFSLSAVITDALGIGSLFIHHDVIPPGRRASATHFHTTRDEVVLVLQGRVVAWCDGEELLLEAGEAVAFVAGLGQAHHVANPGPAPAAILVVAPHAPDDEVRSI